MKILVAGGAGFIGSHLIRRLVADGHRITVLDNFSSGRKENIQGLPVEVINHDVIDKITLSGFNEIYHLASLASPIFYQRHPVETALSNSVGTFNLLTQAQLHKSKILYTSTSEIYGDPLVHPQTENYWGNVNPNGSRSCYDESKRFGESLLMDFHREYGVDTKLARIFNTYGPGMSGSDGRVIPNFINQALRHEPITIYGKGRQTRSFCFVSDMVKGLIRLMAAKTHEPVNLGNPHEITIQELAKRIIRLTRSRSKIIYKKLPADDPRQRCPDISRAKKILKWQPTVDLETGLKETIKHFRAKLKSA